MAERYRKSQSDYERFAVLAVSSLYGVELLQDNVDHCRKRLLKLVESQYFRLFGYHGRNCKRFLKSVDYILSCNILHGNALTLRRVADDQPIIFSEWSLVGVNSLKRRDFVYDNLVQRTESHTVRRAPDSIDDVFIPKPIKDYPLIHFLEVANGGID
ncbi:SAM-dependent DNA methyltransferase [Chelonobacter oris]|uniref:SAM-dependent DNA methyltransferase n=1 Tax=Chelonobacter oris TaxID=505317 RepID=UPI00190F45D9|nr:SAM-dependent DNA methyltransferase [Chelonobacter oris]